MSVPETSYAPSEAGGRIPLSSNQQFLCLFDKGPDQGALGPRHLVVFGWRLTGEINVDALQRALDDVVARHEILRTEIVRDEGNEGQRIHPPGQAELLVSDLPADDARPRELRAEEFTNDIERGTHPITRLPLFRAALGRFDDHDAVLVLVNHHIASDGWSMHLVIRELAAFYAGHMGWSAPELPDVAQYREYAEWQQENFADVVPATSTGYWQRKLHGATLLGVPTDRPVTPEVGVYSVHRFLIDKELTEATLAFSRQMRSSPFMVLFTVFNVLLHRITGATDIVVPTITSGRAEPRFQETVGAFFNFVPLRTDLDGCANFREALDRTRAACFEAYSHEIPFVHIIAQAPELPSSLAGGDRSVFCLQVFQFPTVMEDEAVGNLKYTEIRHRLLSDAETSDIPDGALWTLDIHPSGEMIGSLRFNSNVYDESTIVGMVEEFDRLLRSAILAPGSPLAQI